MWRLPLFYACLNPKPSTLNPNPLYTAPSFQGFNGSYFIFDLPPMLWLVIDAGLSLFFFLFFATFVSSGLSGGSL